MKRATAISTIIALTLIIALPMVANAASTQSLIIGENYAFGEHSVIVNTLVPSAASSYVQFSIDGKDDLKQYMIGDNVLGIFTIDSVGVNSVTVENIGIPSSQIPLSGDNNTSTAYIMENEFRLVSGDILQLQSGVSVVGAIGFNPSQALYSTLLFWSGARTPNMSAVPVPDEVITLTVGRSYEPTSINGLRVAVISATGTTVTLQIETTGHWTISKIISPLGQNDYSSLEQKVLQDFLAQYGITNGNDNRVTTNITITGGGFPTIIVIAVVVALICGLFVFGVWVVRWYYG